MYVESYTCHRFGPVRYFFFFLSWALLVLFSGAQASAPRSGMALHPAQTGLGINAGPNPIDNLAQREKKKKTLHLNI